MVLHFKQEKVFAYFTKKVYNRPDYILGGTLIMLDIKFLRENLQSKNFLSILFFLTKKNLIGNHPFLSF